jgi:prepilin-type N-terminal cleavage/methylation domain-containing protein
MSMQKKDRRSERGFTLIELILVMVIIGVLSAVIAPPLMEGTKGWTWTTQRKDLSQQARIAMDRIVREIRNTGRKADDTPCISSAAAASFSFSDVNGDLINCNSITFSLSGSQVLRGAAVLADNVSAFQMTYYDNNNGTTSTASAVRRLSIALTLSSGSQSVSLDNEVYLKNMRGF